MPEEPTRPTAIGVPLSTGRRGGPHDDDHAMTHGRWFPAMVGAQPCLATAVLPDGTPDYGRGAYVLFPNQEECLWAERDGHVSRHAYAIREPMPWAELHGLREFKSVLVTELNLPDIDPFSEALRELGRRAVREGDLEREGADLCRELAEGRVALRAAAAALDAAGSRDAAAAAREAAGPASPSNPYFLGEDEEPF